MATTSSALYDRTAQRLATYGLFSPKVIKRVARFAERQASYPTYQAFFAAVGVPQKPQLFVDEQGRGVSYIDVAARTKSTKGVIIFHLPMGNPLDSNQLYQVATIAGVLPGYRVVAFGNPSAAPYNFKQQNLRLKDRLAVAFTKRRRVLVAAELAYLESQDITSAYQVGYSYGALKALLESLYAPKDAMKGLVVIEPVAHPRPALRLVRDFQRTLEPLDRYVERTGLRTFLDARAATAQTVQYTKGLRRHINLAIGFMLSKVDLVSLLRQVAACHAATPITVAWASKSELGDDRYLADALELLRQEGVDITPLRLKDDAHAVANVLHVAAALGAQAVDYTAQN